jgi:acetylornithine deacetylase/succinyl-diaminopimelate desuccinylase-like protein
LIIMPIYEQPQKLLQTLIRFDTTNPPGDEAACTQYLEGLLREAGIETRLVGKEEGRPNLIAWLPGDGSAPGLLLQGHIDVVTTAEQQWTHPPFEGVEADGYIWGRGALDMKSGVVMMVCAMLRMKAEGITPAGDVMLCVLCDEEAGGDYGARFLVEEHADLFAGVRYGLGEFGGFAMVLGGQKFYPIQIAEKLQCRMRLTVRGPAGHGSMPVRGGAMARLGRILQDVDNKSLPLHITPAARMMIDGLAGATSGSTSLILRQLLRPRVADALLAGAGDRLSALAPLLRNTISPTIVRGGEKINVIPCEIMLDLDGRMLPGFTPEQMTAEVQAVVGPDIEIEVLDFDPPQSDELDMTLFSMLGGILHELDPQGVPLPYMLPAVSDARYFARLGIQHYGFTPMNLPPDFDFMATVHAADERIPLEALDFGAKAIFMALQRYGRR